MLNGNQSKRRRASWILPGILSFFMAGLLAFGWYYINRMIPDRLSVIVEEEEYFNFPFPIKATIYNDSQEVLVSNGSDIPSNQIKIQGNQGFSVYSENKGSYQLDLKLFGWLQMKSIQVDVVDTHYAIPCGAPVGVYLKSNGILVIGTGALTTDQGSVQEPALGILQTGDYIEAINGSPLTDKEALIDQVNIIGEEQAVLKVRRKGEVIEVAVNPVRTEDGSYKLGAWVRDDTQGIGTMTYVDMNGNFGALGHGISDSDTGEVVEIEQGELYETEILGIDKGSLGKPGILSGVIYYGTGSKLGNITANTTEGIFGTVNEKYQRQIAGEPVEIGYRQDVKKGPAVIRSQITGEVRDYAIEIQKVDYSPTHKNKSLVIKITDPDLLELTGGIVQGMVVRYNRDNTGNPYFTRFSGACPYFH